MTTEEKREKIIEKVKTLDHDTLLKLKALLDKLEAEQEEKKA